MGFSIFAMPSSSVLLLLSVAFGVGNALPWNGARATGVYEADNWTPRPTEAPSDPSRLFKRKSVSVNICGWIAGVSSNAAVCSTGSSCIHDYAHGYIGCCATSGPCTEGVYTTCLDMNSADWTASPGIVNNGIYTCSGTSVCYRNTYPGGYFQYGCGSSNWAGQVATTFSGQATDLLLQVVYTAVTFSPMSAKPSTSTSSSSSSTSTSSTTTTSTNAAVGAGVTNIITSTSGTSTPSASATAEAKKTNVGALAGGIGGGLAGLALISALIFFLCCRGRRNKKIYREDKVRGSITSTTPFHAVNAYAPEDHYSSRDNVSIPQTTLANAFPQRYEYAGAAQPDHPYAPNPPVIPPFPHLGNENTPLVSTEIDDFSRGYQNATNSETHDLTRDTHIHDGDLPSDTHGIIPIGAPIRGLSLAAENTRTQDLSQTSEAFRSIQSSTNSSHQDHEFSRIEDWRDEDEDTASHHGGRSSPEYEDELVVSSQATQVTQATPPMIQQLPGISLGGGSPLRENIMANLAAAAAGVMGRAERERDDRPRYQLVDEVVGDHVPILHSPGQLRGQRAKRSQ